MYVKETKRVPTLIDTSENLILRPLTWEDLPLTLQWRNIPWVRSGFFNDREITREEHETFYASYLKQDNEQMWIIQWCGEPIGQIGLVDIDFYLRSAEYGRLMIPHSAAINRNSKYLFIHGGIAKLTLDLVLDYAFKFLKLKSVVGFIKNNNISSLRLAYRCGFYVPGSDDIKTKVRIDDVNWY